MNQHETQGGNKGNIAINPEKKLEFFGLVMRLLSTLPERSQEIIRKRYGLDSEKGETLEKIGDTYGITRERVRQIISDILRNIAETKDEVFEKAEEKLIFTIERNNGIIKEKEIIRKFNLNGFQEANAIRFVAECSKKIKVVVEKGMIEKSWVVSKDILEKVRKVRGEAVNVLEGEKQPLTDEEIAKKIAIRVSGIVEHEILSYLKSLSKIQKNKFGKWGMSHWVEINPKGTREKIYLVLKEEKRPLHFTEIAILIDKHGLGKRKAHPQTVHNELIKDDRFVLIGRGIYALAEWGYSQGTIRDVLKGILSDSEKPLTKDEILAKVLKMRKVKKTTVMINLNNNRIFERNKNHYSIKQG